MKNNHLDPNTPAYTNAILENIQDKFQVIVEATKSLPDIHQKLEATFDEVGKLRVSVDSLKKRLETIERALAQ